MAFGFAMGPLQVHSYINQPLDATIPLVLIPGGPTTSLSARCFDIDSDAAGDSGLPVLRDARIDISGNDAGGAIHITSRDAITEPVEILRLRSRCDGQNMVREYTFFLDPAPTVSPLPTAVPAPARQIQLPGVVADSGIVPVRGKKIWTVKSGDTLSKITRHYLPGDVIRQKRLAQAILLANPSIHDANRIQAGEDLVIPDILPVHDNGAKLLADSSDASVHAKRPPTRPHVPVEPAAPSYRVKLSTTKVSGSKHAKGSGEGSDVMAVQSDSDDKTAQMLELNDKLAQLEKQVNSLKSQLEKSVLVRASRPVRPEPHAQPPTASAALQQGGNEGWMGLSTLSILGLTIAAALIAMLGARSWHYRQV